MLIAFLFSDTRNFWKEFVRSRAGPGGGANDIGPEQRRGIDTSKKVFMNPPKVDKRKWDSSENQGYPVRLPVDDSFTPATRGPLVIRLKLLEATIYTLEFGYISGFFMISFFFLSEGTLTTKF